jgi:hypothetical protein
LPVSSPHISYQAYHHQGHIRQSPIAKIYLCNHVDNYDCVFPILRSSQPALERTKRIVQAVTRARQTSRAIVTLVRRLARQALAESLRAIPNSEEQ